MTIEIIKFSQPMNPSIFAVFSLLLSISADGQVVDHPSAPPQPLTHDAILAWHQGGGLSDYHWPKQHSVDLNGDGVEEEFLGVNGYGRGMIYALFTKTNSGWKLLADDISGSHHDPNPLPEQHDGWHDFEVSHPNGRGGLIEIIYTWNGQRYVEKSSREISERELIPR